jgi:hypothetical protein
MEVLSPGDSEGLSPWGVGDSLGSPGGFIPPEIFTPPEEAFALGSFTPPEFRVLPEGDVCSGSFAESTEVLNGEEEECVQQGKGQTKEEGKRVGDRKVRTGKGGEEREERGRQIGVGQSIEGKGGLMDSEDSLRGSRWQRRQRGLGRERMAAW